MRYIRLYNNAPKTVKWKYFNPNRRELNANQLLQFTSVR